MSQVTKAPKSKIIRYWDELIDKSSLQPALALSPVAADISSIKEKGANGSADSTCSDAAPATDVTLKFGPSKQLQAHSMLLGFASSVLRRTFSQGGKQSGYELDVQGDSYEGWQHLLDIINLHKPEPSLASFKLASAQSALPVAAKYGITRPIQRYAQHVQHVLLPSMVLKDAVQWLDLFCHTCKSSEPIITALVLKCDDLVKSGSGMADAAAFLAGTADMTGDSSGASRELHPLAATKLLGIVIKHRSEASPELTPDFICNYCRRGIQCKYWKGSVSTPPVFTYVSPKCTECGQKMARC